MILPFVLRGYPPGIPRLSFTVVHHLNSWGQHATVRLENRIVQYDLANILKSSFSFVSAIEYELHNLQQCSDKSYPHHDKGFLTECLC